jgi:hypothetical protein
MITTARNYTVVPQIPTLAGYAPVVPMNAQAPQFSLLPAVFPCPAIGEQVVLNPAVSTPQSPIPLVVAVPTYSIIEGKRFELSLSGRMLKSATVSGGFNLRIYLGTSMTLAQNIGFTNVVSAAAIAAAVPFSIKCRLVADSTSGLLTGSQTALVGPAFVAEALLATLAAFPINFANDPVMRFMCTVNPTVANPANALKVEEFAVNF